MKNIKKLTSIIICVALMLGVTSCTNQPTDDTKSKETSSIEVSSFTPSSSEVPSSSEEISSHEVSSEVSSIVSKIQISQSSSKAKAPVSSKNVSPKPPSSKVEKPKPTSSTPPPAPKPPASSKPNQGSNISHQEMRAVWIAFLEFDSFRGSDQANFTARINQYFDTVVSKGLNTVIVQVRPHGDSMYESAYYPWSKHASGTVGQGVSYDPLAIMVSEAHKRSLEIHAWINPYRTMTDDEFAYVDDGFKTKQWFNSPNRQQYMIKCADGRWWLQPGNKEAQQLIIDGAKEIVSKYSVDGVHIDDYFYNASVSTYGDSVAQAKANTTAMVKGLHDGVKSVNSRARFGVSPAGGFRENNALPSSDMGSLSTDLALWCSKDGYIDYVMPQIYWDYNHSLQPYTMTLRKWENFVTADSVALYIGLAPYRLSSDIIRQQISDIKASNRASGYALFRYDHILGL